MVSSPEPRMIATWAAPIEAPFAAAVEGGKTREELLVSFDRARARRLLIIPALFDEANKLRRFTIQTMREADLLGLDTFLPDIPGCNESLAPLEKQTLEIWRGAIAQAAQTFAATHILAIRGGAIIAPAHLPGWQYAPLSGPKLLRAMMRARTIASREAGLEETSQTMLEEGRKTGLTLAGWPIGAAMLRELETAEPAQSDLQNIIAQKELGGAGLWLRAEPGEDANAAHALAAILAGDGI